MPIYAFHCESCGGFELTRPMSEASVPADCPGCGAGASRRFTAPTLRQVSSLARAAALREERSRHEPLRAAEPTGGPLPHRHGPKQPWAVSH